MERSQERRPLVSVIMPSYNAEKYLSEAIESVIAQTYSEWELLIIDDGSTDRSSELAEAFAAADRRISFYANPKNIGVAKTRNRGLDLAAGEWIALLDSDDLWHADKLEKQLETAQRTGAQIIYTSYSLFADGYGRKTDYNVPLFATYDSMLKENVIGCSTVLLHRSVVDGHRFPTGIYHEDYALWLEMLRAGYTAAGCPEVLADWRITESSRSFNKWSAAKNRWIIYRKAEKLPMLKAVEVFAAYAFRGIAKHKRI